MRSVVRGCTWIAIAGGALLAACGPSAVVDDVPPCEGAACDGGGGGDDGGGGGGDGGGDVDAGRPAGPTPCGLRLAFRGRSQQVTTDVDVWMSKPDGTALFDLTSTSMHREDFDPRWAPNGSALVFTAQNDVMTVRPDGTGERRLTDTPGNGERMPAWSPDASRVAYLRDNLLWIVNADGSSPRQLSSLSIPQPGPPSWSPDGTAIAVIADRDLYTVQVADGSTRRLTTTANLLGFPQWAPAGNRIAYGAPNTQGFAGLFVMNVATGQSAPVVQAAAWSQSRPAWSPDGQQLAFLGSGEVGLYRATVGSTAAPQLVLSGGSNQPAWSPDGAFLAVQTTAGGVFDLVVVRPDGTGAARLNLPQDRFNSTLVPTWARFAPCP